MDLFSFFFCSKMMVKFFSVDVGEERGGWRWVWWLLVKICGYSSPKKGGNEGGTFVVVELGKKMAGPMVISGELGLGSCLFEWLFQLHFEGRFWIYFVAGRLVG